MRLAVSNLGLSVEGRPILSYATRRGAIDGLMLGGMHGDEPKSVYVLRRLLVLLEESARWPRDAVAARIVPEVNPDGLARRRRRNARGVDLNRNFPTHDWSSGPPRRRYFGGPAPASEPETRCVCRLVLKVRPKWIVTLHSINGARHCNNFDGPGRGLARRFAAINGYPLTASIGYPTPGSFGTWAGRELGIAVLTLELPSHRSPRRCWDDNRDALLSILGLGAEWPHGSRQASSPARKALRAL